MTGVQTCALPICFPVTIRAVFLEIQDSLRDGVYVFVAKEKMNHMSYEALKKGIVWSMKKLDCFRE